MINPIFRTRLRRKLNLDLPKAVVGDENGQIFSDPINRKGYIKVRRRTAAGLSKSFDVRLGRHFQMELRPGAAIVLGWEDGQEVALGPDVVGQIAAGYDPNQNNAANRPMNRWIKLEDIAPFATTPDSPESTFITVLSLFWVWGKTVNHFYASEDSGGTAKGKIDLSSYIPAAGSHRFAGVFLKNDNTIEISASTTQTMDIPLDATDVQECLTGASAFTITGDIWYLHDNQSTIIQSDLQMSLRQIYNVPQFNYSPVRVVTAAGAVTITTADYVVVVNKTVGAATTVNLPASPATGLTFIIKDGKGDAATNNITITPAAGNIDGAATKVIDANYGSQIIAYNGSEWSTAGGGGGGGSGTVTSVALTAAPTGIFDVSGSPVTGSGTLALSMDNQNANVVLAGPASGAAATPAFRALVNADLPALQHICTGRLTLTTATPVTLSDVTGATSIYFTPYAGGLVSLYSGSAWGLYSFTELTLTVPSTLFKLFDIYLYNNAGTLTLEATDWNQTTGTITAASNATPVVITSTAHGLAANDLVGISGIVGNTAPNGKFWVVGTVTADTFQLLGCAGNGAYVSGGTWYKVSGATRATALTTQDGVYVKTGATTRRYLGTGLTGGTSGQIEHSLQFRQLWNYYNQVDMKYLRTLSGDHTYATAAWRPWGNNGQNLCILVVGVAKDTLEVAVNGAITGNASGNTYLAGSIDYANSGTVHAFYIWPALASTFNLGSIKEEIVVAAGAHFAIATQYVSAGTSTYYDSGRITGRIRG